jgi:pimeloyl-ACP methyl ester carboxylesterase
MGRFQARDGTYLTYQQTGSGPPVILVHGSAANGRRWSPVIPMLARHFTVSALDRRGYGGSEDKVPYRIEAEFDDIISLATTLADGPVDVVAHSYGGLCALGAGGQPGPLRRLVVYEPPLPMRAGAYFQPALIATMRDALAHGDKEGAAAAFAGNFAAPGELDSLRSLVFWSSFVTYAPLILRELETVEGLRGCVEYFAKCRLPTLLLLGGNSDPDYRETAEGLRSALPSCRISVLEDQKHAAINAAPQVFADKVIGFLTSSMPIAQAN